MANITEQDIIEYLKEKIEFHRNEGKRLEGVLSAFTGSSITPTNSGDPTKPVDEAPDAIDNNPKPQRNPKPAKAIAQPNEVAGLTVPQKYTDDLPVNAKIAFALNEIGSGFNEDIANAMAQYEPKLDAKQISKQITAALSTLKNEGQIKAEKLGRKEKYSLPV